MKQYIHDHYHKGSFEYRYLPKEDRRTFAFELPDYELIETEVMKSITDTFHVPVVSFKVGVAKCHPNDSYVKVIGRQTAESKMESIEFVIRRIQILPNDNEVLVNLHNLDKDLNIRMVLRKTYRNLRILTAYFEYET